MTDTPQADRHPLWRIVLVSAASLFLEMVLIRWVAAEIRIFAYMHNLLLVAAFLGIGLGCFRSSTPPHWTRGALALVVLALVVTDPFRLGLGEMVTRGVSATEDSVVWAVIPGFVVTRTLDVVLALSLSLGIFALTVLALEPFGQELGACMARHPRTIAAYTANLAGSLVGTWGLYALSALSTGPEIWLAVHAFLTMALIAGGPGPRRPRPWHQGARLLLIILPAAAVGLDQVRVLDTGVVTTWSPYQRLDVSPATLPPAPNHKPGDPLTPSGYLVRINNIQYQKILDLSPQIRAARPDIHETSILGAYDLPYLVIPRPERMLVVGAGTGNDVAAALRHGAGHVDAVEIDPVILDLGVRLHPEQPYCSERVQTHVADARSFFKHAEPGSYDVVWLGLLDSHTTASGYTTLRLDHYVYTRESFAEMRRLLRPGGLIVCTFAVERSWIGDRLYGLLRETFDGVPPIALATLQSEFGGWGGDLFIAGSQEAVDRVRRSFERNPVLAKLLAVNAKHHEGTARLSDDNWPYLYLEKSSIPLAHLLMSAVIIVVALLSVMRVRRQLAQTATGGPFFLLRAAFLLLEVTGVSRAALLFGATWVVTAVVVTGVLSMALLANGWVVLRPTGSTTGPLVGILVCGLALAFAPLDGLAALPALVKAVLAAPILAAPMFFSGILFTRLFRDAPQKDVALAWNLLGALAGGLCEQFSFLFGLRSLTLLALVFYVLAVVATRRKPGVNAPQPVAKQAP